MKISTNQLLGKDSRHLRQGPNDQLLEEQTLKAYEKLFASAKKAGFHLKIVSAYRSYEKQKNIWQKKAQGKRKLLDPQGHALEFDTLSREEVMQAIMRWSAIPGASRHHWGSELDVIDAAAISKDYEVQLTPNEVYHDGPFAPFHDWLDQQIQNDQSFGFFRPYEKDLGGVAPERWHLSYRPVSHAYLEYYTFDVFDQMLEDSNIELVDLLKENAKSIYERYILNICS